MNGKRVLVIGKNGFIGSTLLQWLGQNGCEVFGISGRKEEWKDFDMTGIDSVIYASGLAHVREKKGRKDLFFRINSELASASALAAKSSGVCQYIYISSMNVYGSVGKRIGTGTPVKPDSLYGKSKRQGELNILKLKDENFHPVIIRPPLVCGYGCKGSILSLAKASKYIKFFPDYPNNRSMVDIINLCKLILDIINENSSGIYHPQNKEQISTCRLISLMAESRGKKVYPVYFLNPLIEILIPKFRIIRRIFGDDCYELQMSDYHNFSYCIRSCEESLGDMIFGIKK